MQENNQAVFMDEQEVIQQDSDEWEDVDGGDGDEDMQIDT